MAISNEADITVDEMCVAKTRHPASSACAQCGECCSELLPVTEEELDVIKRYMIEHDIKPVYQSAYCPLLDLDKRLCTVYEVRPTICRICDCREYKTGAFITAENRQKMQGARLVNMTAALCNVTAFVHSHAEGAHHHGPCCG